MNRKEKEQVLLEAPWEDEGLEPPDFDELVEDEGDGGCEAACPHGCWVEPDGWCEHGRPSWLLVLGFI